MGAGLSLQDGGYGDVDGTANGLIVSMGGFGGSTADQTNGSPVFAVGGADGGGGCFIATAAYGSPEESHVRLLRSFRDRFLTASDAGKAFVNFYYQHSPPLARFLAKREPLKRAVRWALLPVAGIGWLALHAGFPGILAAVLSLLLAASGAAGAFRALSGRTFRSSG